MTGKIELTQELLKEVLHYDPLTGIFIRRPGRPGPGGHNRIIGSIAGSLDNDGYIRIYICGARYSAHRLAWLYMTGKLPTFEIDHRDTIRNNNRWKNLRKASRLLNAQNRRKASRNNKTGFLGVSPNYGGIYGESFKAQIWFNNKSHRLGTYSTPELAHEAYLKAKRKLHAGCTL